MKKFKIHLIREFEEKDVVVESASCCEACIKAQKTWSGSHFTKWQEVVEPKFDLDGL